MSRDTPTRSAGEQIEFLPPNDAAFGMADVADFVGFDGVDENVFDDDEPRSRWLPALASVVILGLLSAGVVAAAPWDGSAGTSPTTSTVPPTTTTPPSTTIDTTTRTPRLIDLEGAGPPGFLFDDPGRFQLAAVWSVGPENRPPEAYADDWFDLWTTPDATRTSGRWLAVTSLRGIGDYYATRPNGVRIAAGADAGVLTTSADGVSRLIFTAHDQTRFEVGGFGFTLSDLLFIAAEIGTGEDGSTIDYGSIVEATLAGMTTTVSREVPRGGLDAHSLLSQPEAGVYYFNRDFPSTVEVRLSKPADVDSAVYDFLMPQASDLTLADRTALDALKRDGVPVRIRTDPDSPMTAVASWMTARGAVTVSGMNVPVSTLIDLLPSLRLADKYEWAVLMDKSDHGELPIDPAAEPTWRNPTLIGADSAGSEGPSWQVEMATEPASISVNSDRTGWSGLIGEIGSAPSVRQYASSTITFLVATAEWPNDARSIRVTVDGQAPVDIPMVQVGDSTVYAAGYAFTEVAASTVEFFDSAGNPVTG